MSRRPEHTGSATTVYDTVGAARYDASSRVRTVQAQLTRRAVELLRLPPDEPCFLLDIGCGSGLSGRILSDEFGHTWIGTDISECMLGISKRAEVARCNADDSDDDEDEEEGAAEGEEGSSEEGEESEEEEDDGPELHPSSQPFCEVLRNDMGDGIPFRPGSFDGAISISALQWLCNVDHKGQVPQRRLKAFFQSLYNCLRGGARAALQFYPENAEQMDMITRAAKQCGFGGGLLVDFPHSAKAKKTYLVIYAGLAPKGYKPPVPLGTDPNLPDAESEAPAKLTRREKVMTFKNEKLHHQRRKGPAAARPAVGTREWVFMKKAERRRRGEDTTEDNLRYSSRKRRPRF